jgi:hypothetical protein
MPRALLSNGSAARSVRSTGLDFRIDYRFEPGTPVRVGLRYVWVIRTNRGPDFKVSYTSAELRDQGTLTARAATASRLSGPYQAYLAIERFVPGRLGLQQEVISNVVSFR